jgi:hypothetical protein
MLRLGWSLRCAIDPAQVWAGPISPGATKLPTPRLAAVEAAEQALELRVGVLGS